MSNYPADVIAYMGDLAKRLTDSAPVGMTVHANAAKPLTFTVDCDKSFTDWSVPLMLHGEWVGK